MNAMFQPTIIVNDAQGSEALVRQQALIEHQGATVRQLVDLEGRQTSLTNAITRARAAQERAQLSNSLADVERAIAGLKADLAETRAKITTTQVDMVPPPMPMEGFPMMPLEHDEHMFGITTTEFMGLGGFILLLPIALAAARAMWRRGSLPPRANESESATRLARLEQAVESVAIEVERIGESQRFNTRLLTERPGEVGVENRR